MSNLQAPFGKKRKKMTETIKEEDTSHQTVATIDIKTEIMRAEIEGITTETGETKTI